MPLKLSIFGKSAKKLTWSLVPGPWHPVGKKMKSLFCTRGAQPGARFGEIWEPGHPEMWTPKKHQKYNSQNPNPCRQKCRQGLDWLEKKTSRPHLGPSQAIFSMDRTNPKKKMYKICLCVLGGDFMQTGRSSDTLQLFLLNPLSSGMDLNNDRTE